MSNNTNQSEKAMVVSGSGTTNGDSQSGSSPVQTSAATPVSTPVHSATAPSAPAQPARGKRRWLMLALVVGAIAVGAIWGVPTIIFSMHHVTTDDAMVNSHITYVSPRISGVAQDVLVDDNQYVEAGTPLVKLDDAMLKLDVQQKAADVERAKITVGQDVATLDVARADLEQARTDVRGTLAGLRAAWYLVATVQDFVRYETAALESADDNLKQQQASLALAQEEYDRTMRLGPSNISQAEIDQKHAALLVAQEQFNTAQASLQQTRALLGMHEKVGEATTIPSDLAQNFNGTQYAVASFEQVMTKLGVPLDFSPARIEELKDKAMSMGVDAIVEHSPTVIAAKARVQQAAAALGGDQFDPAHPELQPLVAVAQKQLEEAQLRLGYARITAPISGYVTRRAVNPGTHVQEGQNLLAIRPLKDVWIDANFKETQLADLKIGQRVELRVDAYPDVVFHGRVAGFSPGTGAMMSVLPPENATGNYVKVVQRLPVRIELTEENSKDTPLFAGLSVEPEVDLQAQPSGPDAGKRLLSAAMSAASASAR